MFSNIFILFLAYYVIEDDLSVHNEDDLFSCADITQPCTMQSHIQCVHSSAICDGVRDCVSHQDEYNCSYTNQCTNAIVGGVHTCLSVTSGRIECLTSQHLCNGIPDCVDMSDETNCGNIISLVSLQTR